VYACSYEFQAVLGLGLHPNQVAKPTINCLCILYHVQWHYHCCQIVYNGYVRAYWLWVKWQRCELKWQKMALAVKLTDHCESSYELDATISSSTSSIHSKCTIINFNNYNVCNHHSMCIRCLLLLLSNI